MERLYARLARFILDEGQRLRADASALIVRQNVELVDKRIAAGELDRIAIAERNIADGPPAMPYEPDAAERGVGQKRRDGRAPYWGDNSIPSKR